MPSIEETLLAEQLRLYKLQRHDFLNHWQVIMGYLQLNHGDKALKYMRKMLNQFETEQKVGQIPQTIAAAAILSLISKLHKEEIPARISFPEIMIKEDFWLNCWKKEYAEVFYGYTKECLEICLAKPIEQRKGMRTEIILAEEAGGFSFLFKLFHLDQELFSKKEIF